MKETIFDPTEYKNVIAEYRKMQALMVDPISSLPTLAAQSIELAERLEKEKKLNVLSVRIIEGDKLEGEYGFDVFDEWIKKLGDLLKDYLLKNFAPYENAKLFVYEPRSDIFFIVFPGTRDSLPFQRELDDIISREIQVPCKVTYTKIVFDPMLRVERVLLRAFERLHMEHLREESRLGIRIKALFRMILKRGEIRTLFQPIFSLREEGKVFGYEALSRGPQKSELEEPSMLFSVADTTDELFKLESLCHWQALINSKKLSNNSSYIFLNTSVRLLQDSEINYIQQLLRLIEELEISKNRLVVELTERYAVTDFKTLKRHLNILKDAGIRISVDDVGVGYSSLHTLAELQPDFLKYDMVLVRDIHKDLVKQELLKIVVHFGDTLNSPVIAEGVENEEELETLKKIGVSHAQGFLLARPMELED